MTTQNLNTGPLRQSGHKEATEDHATVAQMHTSGDDGNPEALLKNRILSNGNVSRAALYDETDFLCIASSTKQFNLEPDDVRKILDGLLTYARQGDPTVAGGAGEAPKHISIGSEGKADVKDGDADHIVAELAGKVIIAARTAKYVLLVEATSDANQAALETVVLSFQEGLQKLTL